MLTTRISAARRAIACCAKLNASAYRRNPVAINLKTGRTNTIGVIVPEMHTPYAAQVVAGIQNVLYKNNQKVMIAESDESPERERMNLQMMEEFMVDGLIVSMCSWRKNTDIYKRLIAEGLPIVFYDRLPHGMENVAQVMVDDGNDSFFMTEHLIRLGRRRIAFLNSGRAIMKEGVSKHPI